MTRYDPLVAAWMPWNPCGAVHEKESPTNKGIDKMRRAMKRRVSSTAIYLF